MSYLQNTTNQNSPEQDPFQGMPEQMKLRVRELSAASWGIHNLNVPFVQAVELAKPESSDAVILQPPSQLIANVQKAESPKEISVDGHIDILAAHKAVEEALRVA